MLSNTVVEKDSKSFSFELQVNGKEASVNSTVLVRGYTIPWEELASVIAELINFKLFSKHLCFYS